MADIPLELTHALEAYLAALLYRNTRTVCLSVAALCARVSHDALHRLLYALCMAEQAAMRRGQTSYAFKRELFRLPIPERLPQWRSYLSLRNFR